MAVVDKYVLDDDQSAKPQSAAFQTGSRMRQVISKINIGATDEAASIYRFVRDLNPTAIVTKIELVNTTGAGATDCDIGVYLAEDFGGTVKDKDVFADGLTLATARAFGSELDCFSAMTDITGIQNTIAAHAGEESVDNKSYDLALTMNTAAGAQTDVIIKTTYIEQ